jgi:hypothetical protein
MLRFFCQMLAIASWPIDGHLRHATALNPDTLSSFKS